MTSNDEYAKLLQYHLSSRVCYSTTTFVETGKAYCISLIYFQKLGHLLSCTCYMIGKSGIILFNNSHPPNMAFHW